MGLPESRTEPSPASTRRLRDRRAAILDAAATLFARHGFSAVGIDDIGAELGISGPALYRHFPGKAALLSQIVEQHHELYLSAVENASGPPLTQVQRALQRTIAELIEHPAEFVVYVRESPQLMAEGWPDVERRGVTLVGAWEKLLLGAISDLGPAEAAIRIRSASGALASAAPGLSPVAKPQAERLLNESLLRMLTRPSLIEAETANPPTADRTQPAWLPKPSRAEQIIAAAIPLFSQKGYHGVSIEDIAAAAGVPGRAIYRYFDNKSTILTDAYSLVASRVTVGAQDALNHAGSPGDALIRLVDSYVEVSMQNRDLIVVYSRESVNLPPGQRERASRTRRELRNSWVHVLKSLRPELSDSDSFLLVRAAMGAATSAAQTPDLADTVQRDVTAQALMDLLLPASP